MRAGIRAGTEICALGVHSASMAQFLSEVAESGLTEALQQRDEPFGDYRTGGPTRGLEP